MRSQWKGLCALAVFLTVGDVSAGESSFNVVVVANQNSSNSLALANSYCERRCIPPQNVLLLNYAWSGGSISCTEDEFQNELRAPLLDTLQNRALTNQIQVVLLSMDLPYEVIGTNGVNSVTSALFYGFKPDSAPPPGYSASCSLPNNATNSYALSELPFCEASPNTAATNSFLAVMLTDTNLAAAQSILNLGVASDSTFPTRNILLAKTSDPARNVRYVEFDNAIFEALVRGDHSIYRSNTDSTSSTNLSGFETGLTEFAFETNTFVPGAIADNLTSFGGELFQSSGQTPLLAFLEAGAAGSYGTVIEPCNYQQKFPDPLDYFYQNRGFCLAEAYYQSIQYPYQGLMVGEPLSAPFARRGSGSWTNLPPGTITLSGRTNLEVDFSSAAGDLPFNQVDLFIDGVWWKTLTNIPPASGDILSAAINGVTNSYTVPSNATIQSVATGLASALNSASNSTLISATSFGDRIELCSLNPLLPGASVPVSVNVTNAAASPVTFLNASLPCFLDSVATGYHNLTVSNTPAPGDWLQLAVTTTNGDNVTLAVTNVSANETIGDFMETLFNAVNGTMALQSADGVYADDFDDESPSGYADFNLYARTPGWPASAIQTTLTASADLLVAASATSFLQDNLTNLEPRNHLYIASGTTLLSMAFTLDTTQLPDGYHELAAVAYEGTSVRTQTRATQNVLITNTGLTAALNVLFGGSNTDINATLQFSVAANTNTVTSIVLYTAGGLVGAVSNQSTAYFSVAGTNIGLGLHPFYAIVIDSAGARYRTSTERIRLIGPEPSLSVSVNYPPVTLSWPCTAGRTYKVLMATNVSGPYETIGSLTPSNSCAQWIDTNRFEVERFYQVSAPE